MQLDGSPVGADDLAALALYNYGHFTSMLVEDMKVRGLSLHMRRLMDDSHALYGTKVDEHRVRDLVRKALVGGPESAAVRVTVFAPDLDMGRPDRPYSRGSSSRPGRPAPTTPPRCGSSPCGSTGTSPR